MNDKECFKQVEVALCQRDPLLNSYNTSVCLLEDISQ